MRHNITTSRRERHVKHMLLRCYCGSSKVPNKNRLPQAMHELINGAAKISLWKYGIQHLFGSLAFWVARNVSKNVLEPLFRKTITLKSDSLKIGHLFVAMKQLNETSPSGSCCMLQHTGGRSDFFRN